MVMAMARHGVDEGAALNSLCMALVLVIGDKNGAVVTYKSAFLFIPSDLDDAVLVWVT